VLTRLPQDSDLAGACRVVRPAPAQAAGVPGPRAGQADAVRPV